MATIISHLHSGAAGNTPTQLEPGQLALNHASDRMYVGTGSNNIVSLTGATTAAPTAGKGYKTYRLGSIQVYTPLTAVNLGGTPAITSSNINTAIGTTGVEGDIAIISSGTAQGTYIVDTTGVWTKLADTNVRVTDVSVFATVAAFNSDSTVWDEGDIVVINDSTNLSTMTAVGTIPAGMQQGANYPASLIYDGAAWRVLGNPSDTTYTNGSGILAATAGTIVTFSANFTTSGGVNGTATTVARGDHTHPLDDLSDVDTAAVAAVTAANQDGVLVRDASSSTWKRVSVLAAGTF